VCVTANGGSVDIHGYEIDLLPFLIQRGCCIEIGIDF